MNQNDVFKPLKDKKEIDQLFVDLVKYHSQLILKTPENKIIELNVKLFKFPYLYCENAAFLNQKFNLKEATVFNFNLGTEKYFFKSTLHLDKQMILVDVQAQFYQLQRRQNYRVKIPSNYRAHLEILSINDQEVKNISAKLIDLSAGGLRAYLSEKKFPLIDEDKIKIKLLVQSRDEIQVDGAVMSIKTETALGPYISFGLSFINLTPDLETKLFNLTTELYRELFSRLR